MNTKKVEAQLLVLIILLRAQFVFCSILFIRFFLLNALFPH